MLNLVSQQLPQTADKVTADKPVAEPVIRLASLHSALRLVDEFGGGPASDFDIDGISECWTKASEAERRCFDQRSAAMLAVASAGIEVVLGHREHGGDVSPAAMQLLADEIRLGLKDIERLVRD